MLNPPNTNKISTVPDNTGRVDISNYRFTWAFVFIWAHDFIESIYNNTIIIPIFLLIKLIPQEPLIFHDKESMKTSWIQSIVGMAVNQKRTTFKDFAGVLARLSSAGVNAIYLQYVLLYISFTYFIYIKIKISKKYVFVAFI